MNGFAKADLKSIWPGLIFSTDLYAPQAVMDGKISAGQMGQTVVYEI